MIREARSGKETSANPRVYTERFPRSCVEPVKCLSNSIKIQELEPKRLNMDSGHNGLKKKISLYNLAYTGTNLTLFY